MNEEQYHDWAKYHATMFSFTADQTRSVYLWFVPFKAAGFTLPELGAATMAMTANPPTYPADHLRVIQETILASRANSDRAKRLAALGPAKEYDDRGTCDLCGETGWVVVPNPDASRAGTVAVVCSCSAGRRLIEGYERRPAEFRDKYKRPMLFAEYIRAVPNWKSIQREQEDATAEQLRRAFPVADRAADDRLSDTMDRAWQSVMARLEKRRSA